MSAARLNSKMLNMYSTKANHRYVIQKQCTFSMSSWSLRVNPLAASSLSKKPEDFVMEENVGLEFDSKSDSDPSSLSSSSSSSWPDKLNLDKVNGQTLVRWWDNLTWCKRMQEIRTKSCFSLYKDINTVRKIYGCVSFQEFAVS